MKSRPFLVAIAAFAVTATGVQAYQGTKILQKAGLNDEQIEAFEAARELREAGDLKAARDALLEAGVDESVMKSVHRAMHLQRNAITDALEAGDYEAFTVAVAGTPLQEAVATEVDFQKLIQAQLLREAGKYREARRVFENLGIETFGHHTGRGYGHKMMQTPDFLTELTDEQVAALEAARKANNKEAVRAILAEAGIEKPAHGRMRHW